MASYWDKYWTRRRVLGTGSLAGLGAASLALVGCGDDDNSKSSSGLASLATATPASSATVDPFAGAVSGGTYKQFITGDPPTLDPYANVSFVTKTMANYVYSRLFKFKTGVNILRADVTPMGDLAASSEQSPDGLKWTIKLKPGIKFHNVAPVNGRVVTTDDIKFSWGRVTDPKFAARTQFDFVDHVEFPDATTIIFTLKQPNVGLPYILADSNLLIIMPTEADGKFEPTKQLIGSGPWIFDSYTPSVSYKMKKNPDWYEKGFPLFDAVEAAIIPEAPTRTAQFLAGNLDEVDINANDLIDMKGHAGVQISSYKGQGANWLWFDGQDQNAPQVKDERIRQAFSMAVNRDDLQDLAYNTKKLKAAGIKVSEEYNNFIGAGWGRFWLDPKSSAAGEGGKFWNYNVAEAKKLMSAAGYTDANPFTGTFQYPANIYGTNFNNSAEATLGFLNALGSVKLTVDVQDYASKYITQTFLGNFKGVAFGLETGFTEVGSFPNRLFRDNGFNHARVKDATLDKFAQAQQIEPDDAKRVKLFQDAELYHSTKMWYIPLQIASGESWIGGQANLHNNLGFWTLAYGAPTERTPYLWKSK